MSDAAPDADRHTYRLAGALVLCLGLAHVVSYLEPFEDAYITFRYADNVLAGHGPVYNPGERVEGATSLGWVGVCALLGAAGLPIPAAATTLSVLAGIALLVLVPLAGKGLGLSRPARLVALLIGASSGTLAYFSATGMETTAFASLVTAGALLTAGRPVRPVAGAALLGVATWVRPEGIGYAAAIALALAVRPSSRRIAAVVAGGVALLFVPFFAWRASYYGYLLPNTFYAKAATTGQVIERGVLHAEEYLTLQGGFIALVGLGIVLRRGPSPLGLVLGAVLAAAIGNAVLVGGDTFAFYRFFLPALPAFAVLTALALEALAARLRDRRVALAALLGLGGVVTGWRVASASVPRVSLLGPRRVSFRAAVGSVDRLNADYFAVGRWLRRSQPEGTTVALNAAGIVPYESKLPTIDMLGLNDAHIAHRQLPLGTGVPGHEKHDAGYVLGRRPDLILLGLPETTPRRLEPGEIGPWLGKWLPYLPGDRELLEHPVFRAEYVPMSVPIGDRWLLLFARRPDRP